MDPFSGAAGALMGTATSIMMGVADMPIQTLKLLNIHPDSRPNKGKEKSTSEGLESTPSGESSGSGRPRTERTTTNTSTRSGMDTPPTTDPSRPQSDSTVVDIPDTPGTPTHRSSFMSQALAENTEGSRSRTASSERKRQLSPDASDAVSQRRASSTAGTEQRSTTGTQPGLAENVESAMDTGKGLARIVGAGFKSPMDFSLNIAKGFHNVPKLYGADVRQVDKVTDFQSGLRTAAKVWLHVTNRDASANQYI